MEKLSRVKKYAQLREELMNDAESQVTSSDLSQFAERLNRIDATQFDKMETFKEEHDPIHLRRESYFDTPVKTEGEQEETISSTFNNEYLDEYINEVKQYNKERGYRSAENTTTNILQEIKKDPDYRTINSLADLEFEPSYEETTEIPIFRNQNKEASTISMEVKNLISGVQADAAVSETFSEPVVEQEPEIFKFKDRPFTFIPSADEAQQLPKQAQFSNSIHEELEKEKNLRERLMNETVQMRAQLDGYDKELSEVNDSVMYANKVLNVVLVILILAMLVVGGVLIYWIMLDKGVI